MATSFIFVANVSSISRYNKWENTEENYFEKVERNVGFGEFIEANKRFKYAFWGAILSFIIGIFVSSFFLIPFLALAIWVGYSFWERRKITINVPQTKSNRICHYMICITMNSMKKYDFELKTKEFQNDVMKALYQRIVEPEKYKEGIRVSLKNCNIVKESIVTGGQVLLGDENENQIGVPEEKEE